MIFSHRPPLHDVTKIYPDNSRRVISFKIGFDVSIGNKPRKEPKPSIFSKLGDNRAVRHAKTTVIDIIRSGEFEHFCTFTFDPKKVKSRYDISVCKMIMHRWLESQRKKYGQFDYLIVPEYHKDGAIHFHAVFGRYKGPLRDSGVKHKHLPVYNLSAWKYGFSTAKVIVQSPTSRQKVAGYVSKYITKDMITFAGKKRYWVSRGLPRPVKIHNQFNPFDDHARYIVRRKLYSPIMLGESRFQVLSQISDSPAINNFYITALLWNMPAAVSAYVGFCRTYLPQTYNVPNLFYKLWNIKSAIELAEC